MTEKKPAESAKSFTKEQLVNAARYRDKKDIVIGLFEDGKEYTLAEADSLIKAYLKRKVV